LYYETECKGSAHSGEVWTDGYDSGIMVQDYTMVMNPGRESIEEDLR
jgi:hypothetical protein